MMQEHRSEWIMGIIQLAFVIVIVGLAIGLSTALKPDAPDRAPLQDFSSADERISLVVHQPQKDTYQPALKLNGVVQSTSRADIAPQVSGRVIRVSEAFRSGSRVQKGDLLFEIDPADYILSVEQAEAEIASALSDLQLLQAEADIAISEWQDVFPDRDISDLAARRPQIAAAEARLQGAKASRKAAMLALKRTKIIAPTNARVTNTSLDMGQIVTANQPVGEIVSLDNIEISAPLTTQQLNMFAPIEGLRASFAVRGEESSQKPARVERVDAILDPRTRLATVFIRPETRSGLTIGDFVDVYVRAPVKSDVLAIASTAFIGRDQIWVVSDGALSRQNVQVLGEEEGTTLVTTFDFADGVVTFPPVEAFEGQKVTPRLQRTETKMALGGSDAG